MKETVDSGTGTKAKMKDYTAGGKTGTAQKIPRSAGTLYRIFLWIFSSGESTGASLCCDR